MTNDQKHFNTKNYFLGVLYFLLSLVSSAVNDILSKYTCQGIGFYEVTFFRFLFSSIALLPFIFYNGVSCLKTKYIKIHVMRGILLFLAISSWVYGLSISNVTTATVVSFTVPIFVLVLSSIFLKEHIVFARSVATIVVFCGLLITLDFDNVNYKIIIFIFAALSFAILDIINKKMISDESTLVMLFYSALSTAIIAVPFVVFYWVSPTLVDLFILFILGINANLVLFFLLKAFALVDITALSPYRYFELIISATMSYVILDEQIANSAMQGALLIIPATIFVFYHERQSKYKPRNNQ